MDRKLTAALLALGLFGAGMIFLGVMSWRDHQVMATDGVETEGEILRYVTETRTDSDDHEYTLHIPVVSYRGTRGDLFEDRSLPREPKDFPVGSKLRLKFLPSRPTVVEYADSASYDLLPYLFGFVGLLFMGLPAVAYRIAIKK